MSDFVKFKIANSPEHRLAWLVAIVADAVQIFLFPLFVAGGASPVDLVLDIAVAAVLWRLLGWHWAFLPTFAAELIPGIDLFPHLDCRGLLCNQTARPLSRTGDSAPRTRSSTSRLITFAAENASVEVVGIACLRQPLRFGAILLQPVWISSTLS